MTTCAKVHRLCFCTSYRQFYFADPDVRHDTANRNFWTEEALECGLAIGEGVLGIGTASYGHIRCFFQVGDVEPVLPLSPWQRVVEGSIRLSKGRYAILDCPCSGAEHEGICAPGDYRLRVYGTFLDQLVEGTAGDDYFDFYWLTLWPTPYAERRVLKLYDESCRGKPSALSRVAVTR